MKQGGSAMRARSLFVAGSAVLVIAASFLYARRTPPQPSALIQLVGYETRTNCLVATFVITNTGETALSYWNCAGDAFCAVQARIRGSDTNFSSGGDVTLSMSWEQVVWPSQCISSHVVLPVETESWRVALPIVAASQRSRMAQRMLESGLWGRAFPVSQWSLRLFSLKSSAETELTSATFQVATNTVP